MACRPAHLLCSQSPVPIAVEWRIMTLMICLQALAVSKLLERWVDLAGIQPATAPVT
jgi:hypothetical protein